MSFGKLVANISIPYLKDSVGKKDISFSSLLTLIITKVVVWKRFCITYLIECLLSLRVPEEKSDCFLKSHIKLPLTLGNILSSAQQAQQNVRANGPHIPIPYSEQYVL